MTSKTTFNPDNVAALLRHLPEGSVAAVLVAAAESATTTVDARERIAAALDARLKEVRVQLDAETPVA